MVATTERVYLVGHYDHYMPDPNDPGLKLFTVQADTPEAPSTALIGAHDLYIPGTSSW